MLAWWGCLALLVCPYGKFLLSFILRAHSVARESRPPQLLQDILIQRIREICPSPWQIETHASLWVQSTYEPVCTYAIWHQSEVYRLSVPGPVGPRVMRDMLTAMKSPLLPVLDLVILVDINFAELFPNLRRLEFNGYRASEEEIVKLLSTMPQSVCSLQLFTAPFTSEANDSPFQSQFWKDLPQRYKNLCSIDWQLELRTIHVPCFLQVMGKFTTEIILSIRSSSDLSVFQTVNWESNRVTHLWMRFEDMAIEAPGFYQALGAQAKHQCPKVDFLTINYKNSGTKPDEADEVTAMIKENLEKGAKCDVLVYVRT